MVFDKDRGQSVPTYEHVTNMATASSEQMRAWGADPVRVEPWDPNGPDGVKQVLNRALRCIEEEDPYVVPVNTPPPPPQVHEPAGGRPLKQRKVGWDGASGVSQRLQHEDGAYLSDFCADSWPFASCLMNVQPNMTPHVATDPFLSKVTVAANLLTLQNMFTNPKKCCVACYQEKNPQPATWWTCDPKKGFKLSSKWMNLRNRTTHVNLRKDKLESAFKKLEAFTKSAGNPQFDRAWMKAKYDEFAKSGAQASVDWVCEVNAACYIIYYCVHCDTAPTAHNKWYRCTGNASKLNIKGMFSGKGNGHWRCAICLAKHEGKDRDFMLWVIGDATDHYVAFMGGVGLVIENKINMLKCYMLLKKIGDTPISTKTILDALRELHAKSEQKLGHFPMVKKFTTKDPNSLQHIMAYAECEELSLMKSGGIIEAFDVSDIAVPTLSPKIVEMIIELCFACVEMGDVLQAELTKNQRKIWLEIV